MSKLIIKSATLKWY